MKIRRAAKWAAVAAVVVAGMYVGRERMLRAAGEWLVVRTPVGRADLIYVYAGAPLERPAHAASLYRRGLAPRVATGGVLVNDGLIAVGRMFNEGSVNRLMLVRGGVPGNAIVQMWLGTSTMEETRGLKKLMDAQRWRSVIIVSSPVHMRRIRFTVRRVFPPRGYTIMYSPVPDPLVRPDAWWRDEAGMVNVTIEYFKLGYYHLKY